MRSPKLPGTDIDWNQSWEIALLAFTPQSERLCGSGAFCRADYNATGNAPRCVCLAVFWLTSWGRNAVHTQAHNDAVLMVSYVESLRSEVRSMESKVSHLLSIGDFGAANQPDPATYRRPRRDVIR